MPSCCKLRMSNSVDPGVQVPPFPLSTKNRTECPAASEIRTMRRPSGHRVYGTAAQELLTLIRHCRDFGFSVEDTRALVSLASSQDRDCLEAREIAQVHLDAVRARLAELHALERGLSRFVTACTDQCVGGPAPQCTILKDLAAHSAVPEAKGDESMPQRCCG